MIKRLLCYVLVALGAFVVMGAANAQTVVPQKYWGVTLSTGNLRGLDPTALCKTKIADYTKAQTRPIGSERATNLAGSGFCQYKYSDGLPPTGEQSAGPISYSSCTTANPYMQPTGPTACGPSPPGNPEVDPCSDKNEFIRRWDYPGGGVTPPPNHYGVCEITTIKMLVCRTDPSGVKFCMWLVKRTGERYNGPPDDGGGSGSDAPDKPDLPPTQSPPIKPPPAPPGGKACPAGTVQAGSSSDGTPICMGTGSNPQNPQPSPPKIESEKNEPTPDGGTKNTKTTTTTNSDGSTTTNTTVTITRPDGSKESSGGSTTSNNSAGLPGSADTPEDDKFDLCKQNPHLSICRESSVAGTCGEITCVGDAIQCATLRAAAAMQCQQKKDLDDLTARPEVAAGNAILSGADPMKAEITAAMKGSEVDMSQPTLDASGFVGNKSCLAPRSFVVAGKSIQVDFAELCDNIEPLRYAVLACAWILAYLIVSRSVLGS